MTIDFLEKYKTKYELSFDDNNRFHGVQDTIEEEASGISFFCHGIGFGQQQENTVIRMMNGLNNRLVHTSKNSVQKILESSVNMLLQWKNDTKNFKF